MKIAASILFLTFIWAAQALDVPEYINPVVDNANLLSEQTESQLNDALIDLENRTSQQIALLTISSLEGESIEGYSIKVADNWKIGQEGSDNGVLFLISTADRKLRIEVGRGLEGELTDAISGRIVDLVSSYFKRQEFEKGIIVGLTAISRAIGNELILSQELTQRTQRKSFRKPNKFSIIGLLVALAFHFMFFWVIIVVFKKSWVQRLVYDHYHDRRGSGGFRGGGSGGFGGGGFGGGGFGGGGGGGFGGGGASGSW